MTETDTANVSRETSPVSAVTPRRRDRGGAVTRAAMVDAVIASAREGDFRPWSTGIARRVGVSAPQINHHFGSLSGLCAEVARTRAQDIAAAIARATGEPPATGRAAEALAWLVLVGGPMEAP